MALAETMARVNWKTTGFGIGYAACKIVGLFVPVVEPMCQVLEPFMVTGGFVSAVDAGRVRNIVRAVDVLLAKNEIDPDTLVVMPSIIPKAT